MLEQDFASTEDYLRGMMLSGDGIAASRVHPQGKPNPTHIPERSHFEHDRKRFEGYWQMIKRSLTGPKSTLVVR